MVLKGYIAVLPLLFATNPIKGPVIPRDMSINKPYAAKAAPC